MVNMHMMHKWWLERFLKFSCQFRKCAIVFNGLFRSCDISHILLTSGDTKKYYFHVIKLNFKNPFWCGFFIWRLFFDSKVHSFNRFSKPLVFTFLVSASLLLGHLEWVKTQYVLYNIETCLLTTMWRLLGILTHAYNIN